MLVARADHPTVLRSLIELQNLLVALADHSTVLRSLIELQNLLVAPVDHSTVPRSLIELQNLQVVVVGPVLELPQPPISPSPDPASSGRSSSLRLQAL